MHKPKMSRRTRKLAHNAVAIVTALSLVFLQTPVSYATTSADDNAAVAAQQADQQSLATQADKAAPSTASDDKAKQAPVDVAASADADKDKSGKAEASQEAKADGAKAAEEPAATDEEPAPSAEPASDEASEAVASQDEGKAQATDAEAEAVLKRNKRANESTSVPSGKSVQEHILYYAIDDDGDGFTYATLKDSGKQLKIRATAVVWAAGPNGVEEYNALGRNDDVYSWRPTQVVSGN